MKLKGLYRRWQERKRERIAEDYGQLSGVERAEVERLRNQHDPLGEMARSGTPPPFRDDRL